MSAKKSAIDQLLDEGMQAVEDSFRMAKAAQPEGQGDDHDLEDDFADFDQSRKTSEAAQDDDDDEDGNQPTDTDDDSEDDDEDGQGDTPPDTRPGEGKPFSKADLQEVDAMPLLQSIDEKLGLLPALLDRVSTLETQNAQLAKAVQESARGNLTIAKAVSTLAGQPLLPKTRQAQRQVAVPVGVTPTTGGADRGATLAKAVRAAEKDLISVDAVAVLEELTNRQGIDAALQQMPDVARILNSLEA